MHERTDDLAVLGRLPPRPRRLAVAALLLAAGACASRSAVKLVAEPLSPARTWVSALDRNHPLVGRIWDVRQGRWTDETAMRAALSGADLVLLGETHDNPDHHLLQARVVRAVAAGGRRPALVLEMLDVEQQREIDAALPLRSADAIGDAVGWDQSGWPPFAMYRPIFEAALEAGLPIVAGNLPRAAVRAVVKEGPSALPADVRARLEREPPPTEEVARVLREEMHESHCGHLPESLLDPLVLAQRARDAQLAAKMLANGDAGAILIAGRGHVRNDRGVPAFLAREAPERTTIAIGFMEVSRDKTQPAEYIEGAATTSLPYDFVVFTPGTKRGDPCAGLRKHTPTTPRAAPPPDVPGVSL